MDKKRVSLRRTVVLFLVVVAAGWLVVVPVAYHVLAWWAADHVAQLDGRPGLVPMPVSDTSMLQPKSSSPVVAEGWNFSIPDASIKSRTDRESGTIFFLNDGTSLFVMRSPAMVSVYRSEPGTRKLFSSRELASDYALMDTAVHTTPAEVSFWNSRRHNMRLAILLEMKAPLDTPSSVAVHDVKTAWVHGFENQVSTRGNPGFHLLLYDDQDHGVELVGSLRVWSQAWVNTLLASVRPPRGPQPCPSTACGS